MIEKEITLAGAVDWADALVADLLDGSPAPAADPQRFRFVPVLHWVDVAIVGTAIIRLFLAPGAAATADNQALLYLSEEAEAGALMQCGEGRPVWRDLAGNLDPWTVRITTTGKSGNGRARVGYSYKVIAP
jgi:hypothetical protein